MNNRNLEYDRSLDEPRPVEDAETSFRQRVRERIAKDVGKPIFVHQILAGEWDHTPCFRKTYGELWLEERQ